LRAKVGFVNVMKTMADEKGIMGGELSAHYSFRDNGYADSGFIAWLILLQLLSEDGRKLSHIVSEFDVYNKSPEINIELDKANRAAAIERLKEKYKNATQDELDGLTVTFPDWWFNVRESNTEPLLRVTIETPNAQITAEKKEEILKIIQQ